MHPLHLVIFHCLSNVLDHINQCNGITIFFLSLPLFPNLLLLSTNTHQLLGELLLDRHNFTVMTRYISNPENLKLMMNMLRDRSRNIQFEAFHVFKVSSLLQSTGTVTTRIMPTAVFVAN